MDLKLFAVVAYDGSIAQLPVGQQLEPDWGELYGSDVARGARTSSGGAVAAFSNQSSDPFRRSARHRN